MLMSISFLCLHAQAVWDGTTDVEFEGEGTQSSPYLIATAEELAGFAKLVSDGDNFAGKYLKLTSDIVLNSEDTPEEEKHEWSMIGYYTITNNYETRAFSGHFDGGGHTIFGVYRGKMPSDTTNVDEWDEELEIDYTGWYSGFFGWLENATVENVKFQKMTMKGGANIGGLCHISVNSTIRNVHIIDSEVASSTGENGGSCGGLVATNQGGLIENCSVDASVQAYMMCGVLVAHNSEAGVIRDCTTSGYAYALRQGVGGFVGENRGLIERCSSSADVSRGGHKHSTYMEITCAGFVCTNDGGTIRDCFATGNVVKSYFSGAGFCGKNASIWEGNIGVLENCYSTGDVEVIGDCTTSTFMGDNGQSGLLAGEQYTTGSKVINCFSTGKITLLPREDGQDGLQYRSGFLDTENAQGKSIVTNCYFDFDKTPYVHTHQWGEFAVTTAYMKSQAFVDELNRMSALLGLSKWQYNAGGYPTLTMEKVSLTDYLEGGSGTKDDPWRVGTKEHLKNIAACANHGYHFAGNYILQTADIEMNPPFAMWEEEMPEMWEPIGRTVYKKQWSGATSGTIYNDVEFSYSFNGNYDGGLHEVRNIYCYDLKLGMGFFGTLRNGARVSNLGVTDAYMRSGSSSGILAEKVAGYIETQIRQCWTSGSIETLVNTQGVSGLVGAPTDDTRFYNCYSSAVMHGYGPNTSLVGDLSGFGRNQIVNFLYYGKLDNLDSRLDAGTTLLKNYYINTDSIGTHGHDPMEDFISNSEEMQSKELLNRMNYYVSEFNAAHPDDPLLWWKHNEGGYPTFTAETPVHTVTYVANGDAEIAAQKVHDGSRMYHFKVADNGTQKFAGWYTDEALTNVFESDGLITSDTTLHAKWCSTTYEADYTPFTNTFAKKITLKTPEQLYAFACILNGTSDVVAATTFEGKTIQLGADIVLNDTLGWQRWGDTTFGTHWLPIGTVNTPFQGTFDGRGYTVSGMFMQPITNHDLLTYGSDMGLFGVVGELASISNVNIKASCISGYRNNIGFLAGRNQGCIDNCTIEGYIVPFHHLEGYSEGLDLGSSNGLLIGYNAGGKGSITNCHVKGKIIGNHRSNVGGLVGDFRNCTNAVIRNCSADVEINITGIGGSSGYTPDCVGGLIGYCHSPIISSHVTGSVSGGSYVGGIVGRMFANIDSCYVEADVTSTGWYSGGLAGEGFNINHSYVVGDVSGDTYIGGLTGGYNGGGEVKNSYHIGDVLANKYTAAGLVAYCGGRFTVTNGYHVGEVKAGIEDFNGLGCGSINNSSYFSLTYEGETNDAMRTVANYVGWDFANMWAIVSDYNDGYPFLRSLAPEEYQNVAVFLLSNDSVKMIVGEELQLTASVWHPEYTTVEWRSGNTSILTVVDGKVTAIGEGETDVEVLTPDGQKTVCHVKVETPTGIDGVSGDNAKLTATRKVIENGIIYIIRYNTQSGRMEKYTISGTRVE